MRVTGPQSRDFDAAGVVDPARRGGVAWDQFNRHYERLQVDSWRRINRRRRYGPARAVQRLVMAWFIQRSGAILDLDRKAEMLSRFPIPADPDVVFFGAEVGWEAALVQALFGDGGRVVLVDADDAAYERFRNAPRELEVRAPSNRGERRLRLVRDPERIEYVRRDLFDWSEPAAFDVGIDWGLVEHFEGDRKRALLRRFQEFLRPGGLEITAVPRDSFWTRSFYDAFTDELNFGYRELMSPEEHVAVLRGAGWEIVQSTATATTSVALARKPSG